jgi:anti-sigma-K factor RskA
VNEEEKPSPHGPGADGDLLARYASGTATAAERRDLEARIRDDAALRAELERLELLWQRANGALHLPVDAAGIDRAWAATGELRPAATTNDLVDSVCPSDYHQPKP